MPSPVAQGRRLDDFLAATYHRESGYNCMVGGVAELSSRRNGFGEEGCKGFEWEVIDAGEDILSYFVSKNWLIGRE